MNYIFKLFMYVHVYSEPPKKSWKNYGFKVHKKAAKVIKLFENQMGYFFLKLYFSIKKKVLNPSSSYRVLCKK